MTVIQDAGNLLLFFYDELINKGERAVDSKDVRDNIKWSSNRINAAYNYVTDKGWFNSVQNVVGNTEGVNGFRVFGLSDKGIEQIEDKKKFKATFGVEVDFGILKLSLSKEI